MAGNKSGVNCLGLEILLGFTLVCAIRMCFGYTNSNDGESNYNLGDLLITDFFLPSEAQMFILSINNFGED